jgi:hypothetical protein
VTDASLKELTQVTHFSADFRNFMGFRRRKSRNANEGFDETRCSEDLAP